MGNSANKTYIPDYNSKFSESASKQASSFESLSGRFHLSNSRASSTSISKGSYKKKLNNSLCYSKTIWPSPCTDLIFISHFKRQSRNYEFHIINVIAQGAFGTVCKVSEKKKPENVYALKILKKSKVIEEISVDQIKAEISIQRICSHHPFIVKQIDSWQDRGHLYILSEYVSGGEIFNKICNFPFELVKIYIAEIAIALDFLHNAGIIYRDLKPENILLSTNYHIKLTDFGLSKWLKLGDRTKTICGTYQYMAPEILQGESYGHAVDWWALGILACRMLTNKYPNKLHCNNNKESEPADGHHDDENSTDFFPSEIETIPIEGKDLIIKLLVKDYKMRIKSIFGLQRLAMFKNFKIDLNSLHKISPIDIIKNQTLCHINSEDKLSYDWDEF